MQPRTRPALPLTLACACQARRLKADPLRAGAGGFAGFRDACASGGCGPGGLYPVSEACGEAEEFDDDDGADAAAAAALDDVERRAEAAEAELARRTLNVQLLRSAVGLGAGPR
jgi:hypothetical protein